MSNGSVLDTPGVHTKSTGWTEMCSGWSFKKDGFCPILDLNIRDNNICIFKVK